MQAGGAAVSASITAQAGMQEVAEIPVQVRDRGTGLYELQYTLVQVILQLQETNVNIPIFSECLRPVLQTT